MEKKVFEKLMQTGAALLSGRNRAEILQVILKAVQESGFDRVRLFLLSPDGKTLHGVEQVGMKEEHFADISWPAEDDYRFQIAKQQQWAHVFSPDPDHPDLVEKQFDRTGVLQWVIIPLVLRDEVIGHLAADNKFSRRPILEAERTPLTLFGMQAAAAIEKADLTARDEKKLELFAKLAQATTEIVGQIGKLNLHELLSLVCQHACSILAAEVCSVFLCKREGSITLEAGYGHLPGSFEQGLELPIRTGIKSGFTGHTAHEGVLVNLHGDALSRHPAIHIRENSFSPSGHCYSVLALPLKQFSGQQEKLIGLLRADNKKDETGQANPSLAFTHEDEWILRIFAEVIVVCLENAKLIEHQQLLIENLPHAVIAIDRKGNVTEFNQQAEEILGYKATEVLGQKVSQLYFNPKEPKLIGAALDKSATGKLSGYLTLIRTKTGQSVPISLSAYWLYDHHQRSGSVGIFEDQRKLHDYKEQLELTLHAIRAVADADSLQAGLQQLTELLVARFPGTYCGVLLLDESETRLIEKAAAYGQGQPQLPPSQTEIPREIVVKDFPGLGELLEADRPFRLRSNGDPLTSANMKKMNEEHNFNPPINSLLVLPIKLGNRVLGVLNLAEICPEEQSQFSRQDPENLKLATAVATQSAIFIDRIQTNAQEETRLRQIRQAAESLASVTGLDETTEQILPTTRKLLNANAIIFGFFDHRNNTFVHRFSKAVGIDEEIWKSYRDRDSNEHTTARQLLEQQSPIFIRDIDNPEEEGNEFLDEVTKEAMKKTGLKSLLAIPLRVGDERLGLICALYKHRRSFNQKESRTASAFGRYASLSLKNAKLFEQNKKTREAATAVAKITVLGQRQATLDAIVEEISKATECDAVVLFEYDEEKQQMQKSSVFGLLSSKQDLNLEEEKEHTLVYEILNCNEPYRVVQVKGNPTYENRSFAKAQQVATFVAFPLRSAGKRVGALFVNFRQQRSFTAEELEAMQLFANQAALAIRYAQSTEADERKLRELEALKKLSDQLRQAKDLQEIMNYTIALAAEELGTECCNLILPDGNGTLRLRAQYGWDPPLEPFTLDDARTGSQAGYTILTEKPVVVDNYDVEKLPFKVLEHLLERGIKSSLSVPIFSDNKIVGALLTFTTKQRHFIEEEVRFFGLIADHAATAMRSMERLSHLSAVHKASSTILESFGDEQKVLDQIVQEAVERISGISQPKAVYSTLQLYEADRNELVIRSFYPPSTRSLLDARVENGRWSLDPEKAREGRIGVTGRTIQKGRSQLVNNLDEDTDYIRYNPTSKSELSVPLWLNGKIIGTINVESDQLYGFDKNDQEALEALADHAVLAIQIAQTVKELRETKGLVGTRTAMAWMDMANNTWRHTVAGDASELANRVTLIRGYLKECGVTDERIERHLTQIEQLTKSIQERPVTPPLSSEEGVAPTNLNELVIERLNQLRQNHRYEGVEMITAVSQGKLMVSVSPEWLRRGLDILIDNAVRAVRSLESSDPTRLMVTVSTALNGRWVELRVIDRGTGIPAQVCQALFTGEAKSAKGQGVGLLIAQAVVETYGGKLEIAKSDLEGTEMLIRLPHLFMKWESRDLTF